MPGTIKAKNNQNDEPLEIKLWKTANKLPLTRLRDALLPRLMSGELRGKYLEL